MSIMQSASLPAASHTSAPAASDDGLTHFTFTGKVFQVPGARFAFLPATEEPRFFVMLGDMEASMEVCVLQSRFSIAPDSTDEKLIRMAVKGLRYVADIRPGDSIPSEILDGTASWSIQPRHRAVAERRLQVQLLSWVSGKEMLITDQKELAMFLEQIENKTKLKEAFEEAAVALGKARTDHDAVLAQIDLLARELCYIEALRERFTKISDIHANLPKLRAEYSSDSRVRDEIQRMIMLMSRALAVYNKRFEEVDAQTSEIIGALKAVERQVRYIRVARDQLHLTLRDWDPLLKRWGDIPLKRARSMDQLLSDTYRLLAARFASAVSHMKR
jgi:hypothetical protein